MTLVPDLLYIMYMFLTPGPKYVSSLTEYNNVYIFSGIQLTTSLMFKSLLVQIYRLLCIICAYLVSRNNQNPGEVVVKMISKLKGTHSLTRHAYSSEVPAQSGVMGCKHSAFGYGHSR